MPFINSKELSERLNSPDNLRNKLSTLVIDKLPQVGKREEIPIEIKKVVALLSSDEEKEESNTSIGKAFDLGKNSVSAYSRGRTDYSIASEKPELKKLVDENKGKRDSAEGKAIDTLLNVLDLIPQKLSERTPSIKTLSTLAKDMAIVSDKVSSRSRDQQEAERQVHLHIFVPQQKTVEDYEFIDV